MKVNLLALPAVLCAKGATARLLPRDPGDDRIAELTTNVPRRELDPMPVLKKIEITDADPHGDQQAQNGADIKGKKTKFNMNIHKAEGGGWNGNMYYTETTKVCDCETTMWFRAVPLCVTQHADNHRLVQLIALTTDGTYPLHQQIVIWVEDGDDLFNEPTKMSNPIKFVSVHVAQDKEPLITASNFIATGSSPSGYMYAGFATGSGPSGFSTGMGPQSIILLGDDDEENIVILAGDEELTGVSGFTGSGGCSTGGGGRRRLGVLYCELTTNSTGTAGTSTELSPYCQALTTAQGSVSLNLANNPMTVLTKGSVTFSYE